MVNGYLLRNIRLHSRKKLIHMGGGRVTGGGTLSLIPLPYSSPRPFGYEKLPPLPWVKKRPDALPPPDMA